MQSLMNVPRTELLEKVKAARDAYAVKNGLVLAPEKEARREQLETEFVEALEAELAQYRDGEMTFGLTNTFSGEYTLRFVPNSGVKRRKERPKLQRGDAELFYDDTTTQQDRGLAEYNATIELLEMSTDETVQIASSDYTALLSGRPGRNDSVSRYAR